MSNSDMSPDEKSLDWLIELHSKTKPQGYTLNEDDKAIPTDAMMFRIMRGRYQEAHIPNDLMNADITSWDTSYDYEGKKLSRAIKQRKHNIQTFMMKYLKVLPLLCSGGTMIYPLSSGGEKHFRNIWLRGRAMSGKSLLGTIVAKQGVELGLTTRYYDWLEIAATILDLEDHGEYKSVYRDCSRCDLMVIDGIKVPSSKSNFALDRLEALALARIRTGKCTVLISDPTDFTLTREHPWYSLFQTCRSIDLPSPVAEA